MPTLTQFWRLLESRPSRTAVAAEWKRVAGDCFPAIESMLLPTEELATKYPDPRNTRNTRNTRTPGRWLRVVQHNKGPIIAVDDDDWQRRVELEHHDIVLHRIDLRALRKNVSEVLSCLNISRTPIEDVTTCLRVANWEPKKAASFPVFLVMCSQAVGLSHAALDIGANNAKQGVPGAILLTPTRTNWTDEIEARARAQKLMLVALDEVLSVDGCRLIEAAAWEEYLQAFCQLIGTTLPANYRNKRPVPMRGTRAANIEKLQKAMEQHLIAARDHAFALEDRGEPPELLPRPEQQQLADLIGSNESAVSRCLNDSRATVLKWLWDRALSLEDVMNYKTRRRR